MSFLIYSYAGEKVPWIMIHILLPLVLLSADYLSRFLNYINNGKQNDAYRYVFYAIFLLLVLYNIWYLCVIVLVRATIGIYE